MRRNWVICILPCYVLHLSAPLIHSQRRDSWLETKCRDSSPDTQPFQLSASLSGCLTVSDCVTSSVFPLVACPWQWQNVLDIHKPVRSNTWYELSTESKKQHSASVSISNLVTIALHHVHFSLLSSFKETWIEVCEIALLPRVRSGKLLLAFASTDILDSWSYTTHYHMLLHRDSRIGSVTLLIY